MTKFKILQAQFGQHVRGSVVPESVFVTGGYDPVTLVREGRIIPTDEPLTFTGPVVAQSPIPQVNPVAEIQKLKQERDNLKVELDAATHDASSVRKILNTRDAQLLEKDVEIDKLQQALVERNARVEELEKEKVAWFAKIEAEVKNKTNGRKPELVKT